MIRAKAAQGLEDPKRGIDHILGARMRKGKEISRQVSSLPSRHREVPPEGATSKDKEPLHVKEVLVNDKR